MSLWKAYSGNRYTNRSLLDYISMINLLMRF